MTLLPTGSRLLADALNELVATRDPSGSSAVSEETRDGLLIDVRQALIDGSISCEVLSEQGQRDSIEPTSWTDDLVWDEAQSPFATHIRTKNGTFIRGQILVKDTAFLSFLQSPPAAVPEVKSSQPRSTTLCQKGDPFSDLSQHISPYLDYIALAMRELRPTKEVGIIKIDYMWWLDKNWHRSGLPDKDHNGTLLEMMAVVLCWPEHRKAHRSPEEEAYSRELGLDRRPADWKPPSAAPNRPKPRRRRR